MKRSAIIFSFLILILTLSSLDSLAFDNYHILQMLAEDRYAGFSLIDNALQLPVKEKRVLSQKAQHELLNIASLYGKNNEAMAYPELELPEVKSLEETNLAADKRIILTPLPNLIVDAGYDEEAEANKLNKNTNISLKYKMNERTIIRAEYALASREWWDIKGINLEVNEDSEKEQDDSENSNNPEEQQNREELKDLISEKDSQEESQDLVDTKAVDRILYQTEKTQQNRLGISYKTSDYVTISADYIDDEKIDDSNFSTLLGVEYADERGSLKYLFQIGFGDSREKISGLELGIKDLATLNASYKVLDTALLEDQLKESIWNLGLDLNLSEESILSLGYQLKNKEDLSHEVSLEEGDKESNITAQLEIKF